MSTVTEGTKESRQVGESEMTAYHPARGEVSHQVTGEHFAIKCRLQSQWLCRGLGHELGPQPPAPLSPLSGPIYLARTTLPQRKGLICIFATSKKPRTGELEGLWLNGIPCSQMSYFLSLFPFHLDYSQNSSVSMAEGFPGVGQQLCRQASDCISLPWRLSLR